MKIRGLLLAVAGLLGAIFVCTVDIILGKPVNDITGPRSIPALIICALLVIAGIYFLLYKPKPAKSK